METEKTFDLGAYMSGSIRTIMMKAYKNVLSNPREAKFAFRMQQLFEKSEKRRRKILDAEGLEVRRSSSAASPPSVICTAKAVMPAATALPKTAKPTARLRSRRSSGATSSPKPPLWASTSPCWQAANP